jgi:hypothetical protein
MKPNQEILFLNIAGEPVAVLYDGQRVTSPFFPDVEMEFTAQCGMKITQAMLCDICSRITKQTK